MNVRNETLKPLQEDIGGRLLVLVLGNDFLDLATKAKINKWDYIKLKRFCTAKETINKIKRQSMKWEKIFANHISNKGLTSKELIKLRSKKSITQLKNWQRS